MTVNKTTETFYFLTIFLFLIQEIDTRVSERNNSWNPGQGRVLSLNHAFYFALYNTL